MLETLANIGDFVAAIGVIASLVYLAVQVRHATNVARVEAHQKVNDALYGGLGEIAKDPELHRIYRAGVWKNEPLDEVDQDRLGMILYQAFGAYSAAHQASLIDKELEALSQTGLNTLLGRPFVRGWWSRNRTNFLDDFREFVDRKVEAIENELQ